MSKRVGVCLSGCGFLDGAEIHEAVSTLIALDQAGADIVCCAPDKSQADVVNHAAQQPVSESRNVLIESARIARGDIKGLSEVDPSSLDALIFPGGFGAAKNLSTFATDGPACEVDPDVEQLVAAMLDQGKPIGVICIAPAMLARVLGKRGVSARLTIGNDPDTAAAIAAMGCEHADCATDAIVVDEAMKIVSTPAYMLGPGPAKVFAGIGKLVAKVLELA